MSLGVDNADLIEKYELELWQTIARMHKSGIRYAVVAFVMKEICTTLEVQGYCEDWLNKYLPVEDRNASKE